MGFISRSTHTAEGGTFAITELKLEFGGGEPLFDELCTLADVGAIGTKSVAYMEGSGKENLLLRMCAVDSAALLSLLSLRSETKSPFKGVVLAKVLWFVG